MSDRLFDQRARVLKLPNTRTVTRGCYHGTSRMFGTRKVGLTVVMFARVLGNCITYD